MATLHMTVMSIQYVAPEKDGVLLQEEKMSRFQVSLAASHHLPVTLVLQTAHRAMQRLRRGEGTLPSKCLDL